MPRLRRPPGPEGADRLSTALSAVGAWDPEYAALTARALPPGRTRLGCCLPSPFVCLATAPRAVRAAWAEGDPGPLADFLLTPRSLRRPFLSPLVDGHVLTRAGDPPHAAALLTQAALGRGPLARARQAMIRAAEAVWSPGTFAAGSGDPVREAVPGRVSVVLVFDGDLASLVGSLPTPSPQAGVDAEVLVVDTGAAVEAAMEVVALSLARPAVRFDPGLVPLRVGEALDHGLRSCSGERVVLVSPGVRLDGDWLEPLANALDDAAVLATQPVVVDQTYDIVAAGLEHDRHTGLVSGLLAGHVVDDRGHVASVPVPAVGGGVLAARRGEVLAAGGIDTDLTGMLLEADLCFRLAQSRPGHCRVVTGVVATAVRPYGPAEADQAGRFVARWGSGAGSSVRPTSAALLAAAAAGRAPGTWRWGLYIASSPGPVGDLWGDTSFATSLAAALRELGQEVVVHRRERHTRPGTDADEVVLAIRGLTAVRPRPGKVNVLWVISHPEDVAPEEVAGFDLVYAASHTWAAAAGERAGRDVGSLLQAADTRHLPPAGAPLGPGRVPVFVGTGRDRRRPIVEDAVTAGIRLAVHGPGWGGRLPPRLHRGGAVPNDRLMELYRGHGLVLADHWPDMARHGFLSNRIFDAVAAGSRVICDPVEADLGLFGGAVVAYSSPEHLRELVTEPHAFPPPERLDEIADVVRRQHSFAARARQLLDDVSASTGTLPRR